jgi:hypothetical protein
MDTVSDIKSELPDMTATFDVTESVAGMFLSRVSDVRTRLALSQVSKAWHAAATQAASLPPSLDFSSCNKTCWSRIAHLMIVDGFLELPDARMCGLLRDCWKDGAVVGECKFFKSIYRDDDEAHRMITNFLSSPESWEEHLDSEAQLAGLLKWDAETMIRHMHSYVVRDCMYRPRRREFLKKIIKLTMQRDIVPVLCVLHSEVPLTNKILEESSLNAASLLNAARAKAETDVPSQYFLGWYMVNTLKDTHQAEGMARIQKAADQGNPQASHFLGLACFFGKFGMPIDRLAACGHFTQAAVLGHAEAALTWAKLCLDQPGMMPMSMRMFELCFLDHSFGRPLRFVQAAAKKIYDAVRQVQRETGVHLSEITGRVSDPLAPDATFVVYAIHD